MKNVDFYVEEVFKNVDFIIIKIARRPSVGLHCPVHLLVSKNDEFALNTRNLLCQKRGISCFK